jgi:hypothetical protein
MYKRYYHLTACSSGQLTKGTIICYVLKVPVSTRKIRNQIRFLVLIDRTNHFEHNCGTCFYTQDSNHFTAKLFI